MLSKLFAALLLCAAALNANAGVFRIDAIDPYIGFWSGPGSAPTSLSISFLLNTGDASYTMTQIPGKDLLHEFHSTMSGTILDVSLDGNSLIHNEAGVGAFGGDNPVPNWLCCGTNLVVGTGVITPTNSVTAQFDSHHTATWNELVASADPTALLLSTYDHSGIQAFFVKGPWGSLGAGVSGVSITAVPEPSTYAMLLAGLLIVGRVARRKFSA